MSRHEIFWDDPPIQQYTKPRDHHREIRYIFDRIFGTMPIEQVIWIVARLYPNVVFTQKGDDITWWDKPKPKPIDLTNVTPFVRPAKKEKAK
jgi:hypothetical protein